MDQATALIDLTREHSRDFRDKMEIQEKLCEARHRLAIKDLPSTLRWVVAFAVSFWLATGIGLAVWTYRIDERLETQKVYIDDTREQIIKMEARDERSSEREEDSEREPEGGDP
jgi:hypothetical protein